MLSPRNGQIAGSPGSERHLAETLTTQAGATLKETMAWLGRTTVGVSLRHQHVAENRTSEFAAQLDELIRPR